MVAVTAGTREARLAQWAAGALASSLALIALAVAVVVAASDLASLLREHPVEVATGVSLLGCYVVSFVCLHKIQRRSAGGSLMLWGLSLLAAAGPLVALIYWFGPVAGSILGIAEIVALVIHLVALANV